MQMQPPTPPSPLSLPQAPRAGSFWKSEARPLPPGLPCQAALLPQLDAIRAKHAPRALHLARVAYKALEALQELEETMDEDARALYLHYVRDLQDYKLTFEHECPERAEEYDDTATFLKDAILVVGAMEFESLPTTTTA